MSTANVWISTFIFCFFSYKFCYMWDILSADGGTDTVWYKVAGLDIWTGWVAWVGLSLAAKDTYTAVMWGVVVAGHWNKDRINNRFMAFWSSITLVSRALTKERLTGTTTGFFLAGCPSCCSACNVNAPHEIQWFGCFCFCFTDMVLVPQMSNQQWQSTETWNNKTDWQYVMQSWE